MLSREKFNELRRLKEVEGLSSSQIGAKLGIPARTVRDWMHRTQYPLPAEQPAPHRKRPAAAEEHRETLLALLERHGYTAVQLQSLLAENGVSLGYRQLTRWLRKNRPPKPKTAAMRLSFEPGEAMEVDFGCGPTLAFGQTLRRVSYLVAVLCHSRALYAEFIPCERVEHFTSAIQNAFRHFGGVPRRVICDNCKCAVISNDGDGHVVYNQDFLAFCNHCLTAPCACTPYHPASKGLVEKMVGYIRHNFIDGRQFSTIGLANESLRLWLDRTANLRHPHATGRAPAELLAEERTHLLPLPPVGFDCARTEERAVDKFGRISYDFNTYSVPEAFIGRTLTVKATPDEIRICDAGRLVACHPRCYDRRQDLLLPEHQNLAARAAAKARTQNLRNDFLKLGRSAAEFLRRMEPSCLKPKEQLEKLLALKEMYGSAQTEGALRTALQLDTCKAEYVEHILFTQAHRTPEYRGVLHVPRAADQLAMRLEPPDLERFRRFDGTRGEKDRQEGEVE